MRALTRNKKSDILSTPQRALNFSKYLHETYHKPILLAYMAISTYGENGKELQSNVYKQLIDVLPQMQKETALFYFGTFHYFDCPKHVGFFNAAEEHFGIFDANGTAKPSLKYFNQLN
jgi:hypothetical protein